MREDKEGRLDSFSSLSLLSREEITEEEELFKKDKRELAKQDFREDTLQKKKTHEV